MFADGTGKFRTFAYYIMRDCKIFTLSNGIRVVYQHISTTKIVHCGIALEVGSRDESPANQGIAHFWEHMAFKGTRKRSALDIIKSLESVGGELNAYTDKEKIVFYASVRSEYFELAVDVLADITFQSTFEEQQIERERGVILEEMTMYYDDPEDSLQDEFEAVVYKDHPMGMNILGREETVKKFRKKDFKTFIREHLNTHRIVFSCVGNISLIEVENVMKKYLEKQQAVRASAKRKKFTLYKPGEIILKRPVKQSKCAIGRDAYACRSENRIPFFLLVNMLGGPGMNSRLNLALREKYGFVYSIDAHFASYGDTGLFAVFFGTEPKQLSRCISLIKKELNRFCDRPLTRRQLGDAKEQMKGQLAMLEENNLNLMLMMGRSILDFDRVPTLEEVYDTIDHIDALTIQSMAKEMFDEDKLSYLIMEPN